MNKIISEYINNIAAKLKQGNATEHTYRGDLQIFIEAMCSNIKATNEPKRIACGAPDYIVTRSGIPLGYIEAKDVGLNLSDKKHQSQFNRYKNSLDNLIITNYLDFELFINGEFATSIAIARVDNGKVTPLVDNFTKFAELINKFIGYQGQIIKSPITLSKMMAAKAKLLAESIENALLDDDKLQTTSSLGDQFHGFKQILIHNISMKEFADVYAQTIAYGMFAARLHDKNLDTFSRQEAATLIPKSNPFLRNLFQYVAGYDLDERIVWIVDALADLFRAVDLYSLLTNFQSKTNNRQDPIIHFYETFLAEYDPKLRKSRGVWYTPESVVNFIVRAVDDVLKTEFNLKDGIACTDKISIRQEVNAKDNKSKKNIIQDKQVHKVQILDPATGTGTFLAEVVKHIYTSKFANMQGLWSGYVTEHLVPRLNGFEILMASYAMAHLKLDLLLKELGHTPQNDDRFKIYLTNSLEEHHPDTGTLFTSWLSNEANEANYIKRDTPVMVVLGNPPYSGHSTNKGEWIENLLNDYKQEPSGGKLQEETKWLNDDYVKFIRYAQYFVEKNGEGVLAYINNHGFLENVSFRGMRYNLLQIFDKIYIIDLHGNVAKKEQSPDGSPDKNVFDIKQGVSINIFIKTANKKNKPLAEVYHYDAYGSRESKYDLLWNNDLATINWQKLDLVAPQYYFVPKNFDLLPKYYQGFSLNELLPLNSVGICSKRDHIAYHDSKESLRNTLCDFKNLSEFDLKIKYGIEKESRDQKVIYAKDNIEKYGIDEKFFTNICYRPFDVKTTYYTPQSRGFLAYPVYNVLKHLTNTSNVGLCFSRQAITDNWSHIQCSSLAVDNRIHYSNKGASVIAPLYLFNDNLISEPQPNLDSKIVTEFCSGLNLTFVVDGRVDSDKNYPALTDQITPLNILDYIYAVLHNPSYRAKYSEFLKIDFPRVPYPQDVNIFWELVGLGSQLRKIHLLESSALDNNSIGYNVAGDNIVDKLTYKDNQVWINDTQYFDNVSPIAWEFYIGGYQPAQKWLKDRKNKSLSYDDIIHYMNIINALSLTDTIMQKLSEVINYE